MYEVSGFFQSDLKLGCPPDRSFGQILVEDAGSKRVGLSSGRPVR